MNKTTWVSIRFLGTGEIYVTFHKKNFYSRYYGFDDPITPASLARLLRVMSGKPMLPVCKWQRKPFEMAIHWQSGCKHNYHFEFNDVEPGDAGFIYCPYCGRKVEVVP